MITHDNPALPPSVQLLLEVDMNGVKRANLKDSGPQKCASTAGGVLATDRKTGLMSERTVVLKPTLPPA